jgi:hypothetical protein
MAGTTSAATRARDLVRAARTEATLKNRDIADAINRIEPGASFGAQEVAESLARPSGPRSRLLLDGTIEALQVHFRGPKSVEEILETWPQAVHHLKIAAHVAEEARQAGLIKPADIFDVMAAGIVRALGAHKLLRSRGLEGDVAADSIAKALRAMFHDDESTALLDLIKTDRESRVRARS